MCKEPKDFDYSNKGFLFYSEYLGLAAHLKKRPFNKSKMGDKINYFDCKFKESPIEITKEIFDLLSNNTEFIDKSSLVFSCSKLGIDIRDIDFDELIEFFSEHDKIDYKAFKINY
ncbi:hypothetical protein H311_01852 [Anncaliia algerae PRA109]|nr:hypothetical protein H311_01852 [Anncaliia algerae PRA109]